MGSQLSSSEIAVGREFLVEYLVETDLAETVAQRRRKGRLAECLEFGVRTA
jgi:hypothetical protein